MTTNPRHDTLPSFADLFESVMVNIWGGVEPHNAYPLTAPEAEHFLERYYDSFHNAVHTARAMGGQIIGGPIYEDDDEQETLLKVRFRDGSELMIHASGGGIEPHPRGGGDNPAVADDYPINMGNTPLEPTSR